MQVTNFGAVAAHGVRVSDPLPAGTGFVGAGGANWNCAEVGEVVACDLGGPLAPGAAAPITLAVQAPDTDGSLSNTATVSSLNDPNAANDSDTLVVTVAAAADLSLTKTAAMDPVVAGTHLNYTVQVANLGTVAAHKVRVSDPLPTGAGFVGAGGTGWNCADGGGSGESG